MYDAISATAALRRGELTDCRANALGGAELGDQAGVHISGGWCYGLAGLVEILSGDLDKAELLVERAEELYRGPQSRLGGEWTALARAWIHERVGEPEAALQQLRSSWEFCTALGVRSARANGLADLARLAAVAGDTALVEAVSVDADDIADRSGFVAHRAMAARVRAWHDGDVAAMLTAADELLADGQRLAAALTLVDVVQLGRFCGATNVAEHGRRAVQELVAIGAFSEADRLERSLPSTRRRQAAHGWEALTDTERRVVSRVANGLSNPEIATELFVSRRTVESHVSSALRKLGARSRVDLALIYAERMAV